MWNTYLTANHSYHWLICFTQQTYLKMFQHSSTQTYLGDFLTVSVANITLQQGLNWIKKNYPPKSYCYLWVTSFVNFKHSSLSLRSPHPPLGLGIRASERGYPKIVSFSGLRYRRLRSSSPSRCFTFSFGLQFLPLWWTPLKQYNNNL